MDIGSYAFAFISCEFDEQNDIGGVELPHTPEDPGGGHQHPAFHRHPRIDQRRRIAADEHKQVGGAAEAEIAHRQRVDDIVRDMVEEQKPVRDAEQQRNPEIAIRRGDLGIFCRIHRKQKSPARETRSPIYKGTHTQSE